MQIRTALVPTLMTCVVLAIGAAPGQSQIVPFYAWGTNSVYDPFTAATTATGHGTYMGALTASGYAIPQPTSDPFVLTWTAAGFQFTAANGDQLFVDGSGVVNLIPLDSTSTIFTAVWTADFTVTGGTGRFAKAGPGPAPLSVIAVNNPFVFPPSVGDVWTYSWVIHGKIDLGRRPK